MSKRNDPHLRRAAIPTTMMPNARRSATRWGWGGPGAAPIDVDRVMHGDAPDVPDGVVRRRVADGPDRPSKAAG